AGIAYGLYRIALQRDDAALLAAADLWLARAEGERGEDGAFLDPARELTAATVGTVSPFHAASGLAAVRALVAHAQGDEGAVRHATAEFIRLGLAPVAEGEPAEAGGARLPHGAADRDLTLGRSSLLLSAALLAGV